MSQTKKSSFIEACVNTAVGLGVTMAFAPVIYTFCGLIYTPSQLVSTTVLFTVISVARSYVIRRFFNKREDGTVPVVVLLLRVKNWIVSPISKSSTNTFEMNEIAEEYAKLSPDERAGLSGQILHEEWQRLRKKQQVNRLP